MGKSYPGVPAAPNLSVPTRSWPRVYDGSDSILSVVSPFVLTCNILIQRNLRNTMIVFHHPTDVHSFRTQPFEAMFGFVLSINQFLEKLITWPRDCGKAIMDCSTRFPAPF